MKPKRPQDITTPVSTRFPSLIALFIDINLNPAEVYVWAIATGGHGEVVLVINGQMFEAQADGPIGEGSSLAVKEALKKFVSSQAN